MYVLLDYFFFVFHAILVLFHLTGWAWETTRRLHLMTVSLTFLSWFGLGLFYGWGYCPCTDWHWAVKRELGESHLPGSYVKYYADKLTGGTWDALLIDAIVFILGLFAFVLSCWFNLRDASLHRRTRNLDSSQR